MYCTLEPCCHTGRTGPCVERIVRAGVTDVVVGVEDPDPRVHGAGIRYLRDHGITVMVGVRREAATRLNEAFFTVKRRARPFVTLKAAVSLDGRIAAASGRRTPLTGPVALEHAQVVRAEVGAIGVGSETVLVDDPLLTARGPDRQRPLVRVVFDTRLRTPPSARVLTTRADGPVVMMTTEAAVEAWPERATALERAGAVIERLPARDPVGAMSRLLAYEVNDLLLEGGAVLHRAAWIAGVVDRVRLYVAPIALGRAGSRGCRAGGFPSPRSPAAVHDVSAKMCCWRLMFNGLIETLGQVAELKAIPAGFRIRVATPLAGELVLGESIAVNGVCLTVIHADKEAFHAEISPETAPGHQSRTAPAERVRQSGAVDACGYAGRRALRAGACGRHRSH